MTDLDFGIQIEPQYGFTYTMIKEIAKEAESLGFESIWVSDHFFMTDDSVGINCLECWTTSAPILIRFQRSLVGERRSSSIAVF